MADLVTTAMEKYRNNGNGKDTASARGIQVSGTLPTGIAEGLIKEMTEQAIAWASAHGLLVSSGISTYSPVPFSLLPGKFPRRSFDQAMLLSETLCRLIDRASRDHDWLHSTLDRVIAKDEFTSRLVSLSKSVIFEGLAQKAHLGIFRSDYMLHTPSGADPQLQQVELNTIASSFGCLSAITCMLHRFLVGRFSESNPEILKLLSLDDSLSVSTCLPKNNAMSELAAGLEAAHKHYGVDTAIVLFVVQPGEINSVDQRWLEFSLWDAHNVPVVRLTLLEVYQRVNLVGDKREMYLDDRQVSVVYFRAGYSPADYPSEFEWKGREMIERSRAIKCPSISYHLAGTKKVQQVLANENELLRFVTKDDADMLRGAFAGLFGLDGDEEETLRVIREAIATPDFFVMKPQREGGGNNLYGRDIVEALSTFSKEERASYILMTRICPEETPTIFVRGNHVIVGEGVSELGMYSVSLFDDGKEICNRHAGHLLRTKLSSTNEGGVAAGFAVLSSPLLT